MNSNIKISYPGSEKVYMQGSIYPDVPGHVPMHKIQENMECQIEKCHNAPIK